MHLPDQILGSLLVLSEECSKGKVDNKTTKQQSNLQKTVTLRDLDRIFTTKLCLSQFLVFKEETHNLNVTLRLPKEILGFGQRSHKTQQITIFQRFILNPNGPRTDLQPLMQPLAVIQ